MKWMIFVVVCFFTVPVNAQNIQDELGTLEVERLKKDGWFAALSEVSMVGEAELEQQFTEILRLCNIEYSPNEALIKACVSEQFEQYLSVPLSDLHQWDEHVQSLDKANMNIDEQLKALEAELVHISSKTKLTQADIQKLNHVMQQMSELALEKTNAATEHMEGVTPYIENIINK
ncbi:hypothetical protein [Vibrio fluminensis]|uniref:hypothetical protein n=1 Tax=Vibrio fluminensis TaxID=2783614 RepID=UPI00188714E3|nr:hypothetical protein [Vibrio fluminensis]